MKCPYCLESFHDKYIFGFLDGNKTIDAQGRPANPTQAWYTDGQGYRWTISSQICPACGGFILFLTWMKDGKLVKTMVHPKRIARAPLSPDVPSEFAEDYREACLTLADSPKASAALSRRCLQNLLREKAKTTKKDLADQIDEVLPKLPSYLAEMIDGVRNIGNFAAHPIKSKNTGEIIDVEPDEADWMLDTLESAFDFYLVQPAITQRKRNAINSKLKEAGKPPMK